MRAAPNLYPMPFTRIELVVMTISEGGLVVLLGKRTGKPHAGKWALPGGVVRIDLDKDLEGAAQRVAMERLGTLLPYLRPLIAVGSAKRDPRAPWGVSIAYRALIPIDAIQFEPGKRLDGLRWCPVDEAAADRGLAFDHGELIRMAAKTTRAEVERMDLPVDFIPAKFTLGELQDICSAILGRRLDKSSFRRRLDERALVEPVEGEMRTGAFRPAQLFVLR